MPCLENNQQITLIKVGFLSKFKEIHWVEVHKGHFMEDQQCQIMESEKRKP